MTELIDYDMETHTADPFRLWLFIDNWIEQNCATFERIPTSLVEEYIENNDFLENIENDKMNNWLNDISYNAKKIATFVNLIRNGHEFSPIYVYIYNSGVIYMDDGFLRLRAYMYTNVRVKVKVILENDIIPTLMKELEEID